MADAQTDYAANIKNYVGTVNTAAIAGIVKHLGIAPVQQGRVSGLRVRPDRTGSRVRDGFMKKKPALTHQTPNSMPRRRTSCRR